MPAYTVLRSLGKDLPEAQEGETIDLDDEALAEELIASGCICAVESSAKLTAPAKQKPKSTEKE